MPSSIQVPPLIRTQSSPDSPPLAVTACRVGRRAVVEAAGEIDLATAGVLSGAIDAAIDEGALDLWVDLSDVGFMDSTGLHVLVAARHRLAALNRRISVICPAGPARRVIDLAGMQAALGVVTSRAAAHHAS